MSKKRGCLVLKNKWIIGAMLLAICLACSGCGGKAPEAKEDQKLQVVTTIFPIYDWTREILGENSGEAQLTLLLDKGVDLHSFQPTAQDIMKIATCDVFIYVGGESDRWAADALKEAVNPKMQVLNLMEILGEQLKEEEIAEGMQEEEHDREEEEETEYDEHIWLSLRNAEVCCEAIAEALGKADAENADYYTERFQDYRQKLDELDEKYAQMVDASANKTILVGDRFPFRYLTEDYGLTYYAAFTGCSAETEASFQTVIFLAGKEDELELPAICTLKGSDGSIARTIRDATQAKDQKIVELDSMQSGPDEGATYLSIMEKNLGALGEALGR
ncbi:MAG: zinc ABC transporter substrate-binding protein [Lachnospiraceae bacterium]|nr:zinc ABC transporter substrate-binding protein [Lachnospiraceae bacterium]